MLLIQLVHALCWVYWLGADVGTFYAARFVANPDLSAPQRATAARIMLGIDLAPRLCMPLTLASGFHLATLGAGWAVPAWAAPAVWWVCLAWLAVAVWLHHAPRDAASSRRVAQVTRLDFAWRTLLAAALALATGAGLAGLWPALAPWLGLKLLCFAATVACGLAIRVQLEDFGAAFGALVQRGADATVDATIARAFGRCVPYVLLIWVLLLVSAATGMHLIRL